MDRDQPRRARPRQEPGRTFNRGDVSYSWHRYPLLELGLTRTDCQDINRTAGFGDVPKSACIGCPFHTNRQWRAMRDTRPDEWADAIAFDHAIRHGAARANATGSPLRGRMYLHRSRVPLDRAPVDPADARGERTRGNSDDDVDAAVIAFEESLPEDSSLNGCSPYACRSTSAAPARRTGRQHPGPGSGRRAA